MCTFVIHINQLALSTVRAYGIMLFYMYESIKLTRNSHFTYLYRINLITV